MIVTIGRDLFRNHIKIFMYLIFGFSINFQLDIFQQTGSFR